MTYDIDDFEDEDVLDDLEDDAPYEWASDAPPDEQDEDSCPELDALERSFALDRGDL